MQTQLIHSPMYAKSVDAKTRSVEAVLSSETVDAHGEIVDQGSLKLERFRKNPVVLHMHSMLKVIGHAENVRLVGGELQARIVFATTELANEVFTLFQDGAMRAFSIGFRPGRAAKEMVKGREVTRLFDGELLEVSAVSVPSNPDAIVKHKSLGLVPANFCGDAYDNASDDFLASVHRGMTESLDEEVDRSVRSLFDSYDGPEAA
jgi:HK97 family phage prohead protease